LIMHFHISHPVAHHHPAQQLGARARAGVWMLIGLMLLATLSPAISRTLDHGKSMAERGWVEVCGAHGTVWLKPGSDAFPSNLRTQRAAADVGLLQELDACGFCTVGIDRGTPPPDFSGWGLSQPQPTALPALAGMGSGSHARLILWARGPPDRS
jgi:hypothetical protein